MGRILTRLAGIALVGAGLAGIIFCVVGLFVLARVEQRVESVVTEQLELIERALATTAEGLTLAETSMEQATATLVSLSDSAGGAGQAVSGTVPTVDAVSELLGEQLPATLESTQATLNSAATNAKLVDDVLFALTTVPLLGIDQYSPDVPLEQGLRQVAASLDEFSPALIQAQDGLSSASGDLEGLGENLVVMADSISEVATSLESTQSVLTQYQDIIAELQKLLASVQESMPTWLRLLQLGLSLVLIWLGVAQLGLITQGLELIARSRATK
jgi:uncharacterized phage infection (PIP) family protein YhgE